MKVFLAGEGDASINVMYDVPRWMFIKRLLFSYFYHGYDKGLRLSTPVLKARDAKLDLFLDSGAFSAFTQKKEIALDGYIEFCKEHGSVFHTIAALDAIGDADTSWKNFERMRAAGVQCLPTFHYGEPFSFLERMVAEAPYIALGGVAQLGGGKKLIDFFDHCWKNYMINKDGTAKVKAHGFAVTNQTAMFRYPWHSVDSTSWLMTGINGACAFMRPEGLRKIIFGDGSSSAKDLDGWHYSQLPEAVQQQVLAWLGPFGITLDQVCGSHIYRNIINAATFQAMELHGTDRFIDNSISLF